MTISPTDFSDRIEVHRECGDATGPCAIVPLGVDCLCPVNVVFEATDEVHALAESVDCSATTVDCVDGTNPRCVAGHCNADYPQPEPQPRECELEDAGCTDE